MRDMDDWQQGADWGYMVDMTKAIHQHLERKAEKARSEEAKPWLLKEPPPGVDS